MYKAEPKSFLIAETQIIQHGLEEMLEALGAPGWTTEAASDAEKLMEVGGKLCYLSFNADLNLNLTRTGTRNNHDYLQEQIIGTRHGSVLEHATVSVAILNCSRILTHELVRHRQGTAFSQVSGRFVRTDNIGYYEPRVFDHVDALCAEIDGFQPGVSRALKDRFMLEFRRQELLQTQLHEMLRMDEMKSGALFKLKKVLTSALRRLIGNGQLNHILVTANHRAWRFIIEQRSAFGAEEEIRLWAYDLYSQLSQRYPAVYADAIVQVSTDPIDLDIPQVRFENSKV